MSRNKMRIAYVAFAALLAISLAPSSLAQTNAGTPSNSPMLSCSPAPCVFAPEIVSLGGDPVLSNVVAANPTDPSQMLVATGDSACASDTAISASEDGGVGWSQSCLPGSPKYTSGPRPLLAYGLGGIAYAGFDVNKYGVTFGVGVSLSADNGKTWSKAIEALSGQYAYAMRLEVDNSPTSPFLGSLYITGGLFPQEIVVSHSHDGAKTWATTVVDRQRGLGLVDYFPSVATAADGTVYVTWLLCKEKGQTSNCGGTIADIMFSKSSDGGDTWSTPVAIAHPRLGPGADIALWGVLPFSGVAVSEIPVLAVDNSSGPNAGNVYVCFYHNAGTYLQVAVITSRDQGQTWSSPVSVSSLRPGDQFNPWVSVSSTGTVGVTWLQGQLGSDKYQPFFGVSTDGGVTFTGEHSLDNGLSNPLANPNSFGEYRTHVWVGNALYALWQDNHSGGSNFQVAIGGVQF